MFTIVCSLANLGLPAGLTRQAAYFFGKNEREKAIAVFRAGIFISVIASLVAAIGLFVSSDALAEFFGILSFVVPVAVLNGVLISIFRV